MGMDESKLLKDLNSIFIEVFKNPSIEITGETSSKDIDNWNSLNNMILVVTIEEFFNIRFDLDRIQKLKNVSDLCDCINEHLNK
jgi:acyl carrier protein